MKMYALLYTGLIFAIISDDIKNETYLSYPSDVPFVDGVTKTVIISYDEVYKLNAHIFILLLKNLHTDIKTYCIHLSLPVILMRLYLLPKTLNTLCFSGKTQYIVLKVITMSKLTAAKNT